MSGHVKLRSIPCVSRVSRAVRIILYRASKLVRALVNPWVFFPSVCTITQRHYSPRRIEARVRARSNSG